MILFQESSSDEPWNVILESGGETVPVVSSEDEDFVGANQQSAGPKTKE